MGQSGFRLNGRGPSRREVKAYRETAGIQVPRIDPGTSESPAIGSLVGDLPGIAFREPHLLTKTEAIVGA